MPERTCIATREKADQSDLIRLLRSPDGEVLVDYRGRLGGRGAWVLPRRAAIATLEKKPRILSRALRGPVKTEGLLTAVLAANRLAVEGALSLAARSGSVVGGGERVRGALRSDRAAALVLASDASPRGSKDLTRRAGVLPVVVLHFDRDALGAHVGRGPRAELVVLRGKAGDYLLRELHRWLALR